MGVVQLRADPLTMRACSSIRLPSPMIIGPASAMILALGWITVLGPAGNKPRSLLVQPRRSTRAAGRPDALPTVTSPRISLSTHTTAPGAILTLRERTGLSEVNRRGAGGPAASRAGGVSGDTHLFCTFSAMTAACACAGPRWLCLRWGWGPRASALRSPKGPPRAALHTPLRFKGNRALPTATPTVPERDGR